MYLDTLAATIRGHVPSDRLPEENPDTLLRAYAVLLRAKGQNVTQSDVHDAWSAWMATQEPDHESLVPYSALAEDIRDQDRVFAEAIRRAADEVRHGGPSRPSFTEALFPFGPPDGDSAVSQAFELYKIMVESSESLVGRRQGVNTFFLTINGALLTASGLIVQSAEDIRLGGIGITVLAVAGMLLCGAWKSLITSFGQLNSGKFKVINTLERYLPAAIYAAEWEALDRGEDPSVYRSFTSREVWVPYALLGLHLLTAIGAVLVATGVISLGGHPLSSS